MDGGAMEFKDDSFDTVVAAYVVTAVPDYRQVVSEMIRVCRPGGRIIMLNHFRNDKCEVTTQSLLLSIAKDSYCCWIPVSSQKIDIQLYHGYGSLLNQ